MDPQAVVCWSASLTPTLKNDTNLGAIIGRSSRESVQLVFQGNGFVVFQPSERSRGGTAAGAPQSDGGPGSTLGITAMLG